MANKYILIGVILLLAGLAASTMWYKTPFANYVAPYAPKQQRNWWRRPGWERFGYPAYTFWQKEEGFENLNDKPAPITDESQSNLLKHTENNKASAVLDFVPDGPAPAELYNQTPYHLLGDEMSPPRTEESLSCVNSRSCYATSFERMISKTGNYRQMTNNYKQGYPDSCSSPYQELVLNFYKSDGMSVPANNTGGSVSEAGFGKDYISQ
jgi:hypothetical protein